MAGTPIKNMMIEAIAALPDGENTLLDRVANGETMAALARSLGVSRNLLNQYLVRDDQRRALLARARETSADALAEEGIQIADDALPSNANVARLRIEHRKWLATKYLPDTYGERNQASVTINVNTLHLDALRQLRNERIIDVGHTTVQSSEQPLQLIDNTVV